MKTWRYIARWFGYTVALATMLAGCGGGPVDNEFVRYRGTTLQVEGNDYPLDGAASVSVPGRLQVRLAASRREAAVARLRDFGLSLEGDPAAGTVRVVVPEGYETQWRQALSMEPAFVDIVLANADTPVAGASTEQAAAHADAERGEPMPSTPPSASVVERLTREMFEEFEEAGGIAVALPTHGAGAVVHQALAGVQATGCRRLPEQLPLDYECTVDLKVRSCLGDCDPARAEALDDAKRIGIRWDAAEGEWVRH